MIKQVVVFTLLFLLLCETALSKGVTEIKIATVIKSNDRVNSNNVISGQGKPGWFIELSRQSAQECNAKLRFDFIPWARGLLLLEQGEIDAIFNSTYMEQRAEYGVYPTVNGKLDERRASSRYGYYAYVLRESTDQKLLEEAELNKRNILVERAASILPALKRRGARITESVDYMGMLKMVAHQRADAAVGIDATFDALLAASPQLAASLVKVKTPVQLKKGYVMFSKPFYTAHSEVAECFWERSAENRETQWFKDLYQSYQ